MPSSIGPGTRSAISDGIFTFALRIANVLAALILGVLTARLLGPAGKGVYALPMVQAGLLSTGFAGLMSATSYFMLNERSGRRIVATASYAALGFIAVAALGVLALAAIGHSLWAAPAAIASLPAVAAVNVVTGYVVGIRRVRYATTVALATTLATLSFMGAGLFLVARSPFVAIAAWIASTSLVAFAAYAAMLVHSRRLERGQPVPVRRFWHMALKIAATGFVSLLNYRADLYIVAVLLPPAELGLYTVAVSGAESLLVPTQVAALVSSPHIGSLQPAAAAQLAARCVRNNLLAALAVCVGLFALAPFLVGLLYGAAFVPLVPSLRILLAGVVALSLGSPISNYYTLKLGKPEIPLVLAGVSAAICIAVTLVLVPHAGIEGAAIGSTVAYVVGQGLGLGYFARRTGVRWSQMLVPRLDDVAVYYHYARSFRRASVG